ncbi:MAG: tol-pal system protein YbgF [Saccharospirillum sp.]
MLKPLVTYSAALLGSTFLLPLGLAQAPVVQSQPSHSVGQGASQSRGAGPDPAFVENLMFQVQDLQQQVAEQRGLIEELNYQLQMLNQEQRERYIDLDQRMLTLQQQMGESGQTSTGTGSSDGAASTAAVSDEAVLNEYNAARELIRERQFPEAIAALNQFTENHPNHALTPNAWYWLGEVHLVNREVSDASRAFRQVVDRFPQDPKVPDSLYKLGVIAQQQGNQEDASRLYRRVISEFPDSQSAKLSEARLTSN